MFLKRSYEPEILDDFSIKDKRVDSALKELKIINSLLGGNAISYEGIGKLNKSPEALTILDAGSGSADILINIKKRIKGLNIFCLDKNQRACHYLKNHSTDIKVICGDVLHLPIDTSFDIIHTSLFLHHFNEEDLIVIIKSLLGISKKGIIINDLRRSIFAWLGIKIVTILFSRSREVKYDGPMSVRKGFIKRDWLNILNKVSTDNFIIKRRWAFRWLIVIYK